MEPLITPDESADLQQAQAIWQTDKITDFQQYCTYLESQVTRLKLEIQERDELIIQLETANNQLHHVVNKLTNELGELYYQMSET